MEQLTRAQDNYANILARLNRASVAKHFDAYADVPWDDPAMRIDPDDRRWIVAAEDALGGSAWFVDQPESVRARIGLAFAAYQTKRGVEFENILSRGLLEFALTQPNGSPAFRYAYHELIEEGQHSLMFQEFVERSGVDVPWLSGVYKPLSRTVPRLGRVFPELFFVYVLAGEVPIDQTQRALLRRGDALHPLQRRIMQIHVTEEARHVCFAREYLASHVGKLRRHQLAQLRLFAPFVAAQTGRLMLRPPLSFTRKHGIPDRVMRDIYRGEQYRGFLSNALRPLYETFADLGLVNRVTAPLWRAQGILPAQARQSALPSGNRPQLTP